MLPRPVRAAFGARRDAPDRWVVPAEATTRRTLARVDPTTLAAVIGAWLPDRDRPGRPGAAASTAGRSRSTARRCGAPTATTAGRSTCWPRWTTPPARCSPNATSTAPPAKSRAWSRCWPTWTWPAPWSLRMRCTPTPTPPSSWSPASRPTTCWSLSLNPPVLRALCGVPAGQEPVCGRTVLHPEAARSQRRNWPTKSTIFRASVRSGSRSGL
jgi:hypothetical protein